MLKPGTSQQVAEATAAAARAISAICVEKGNKVKAVEEDLVAPLGALLRDRWVCFSLVCWWAGRMDRVRRGGGRRCRDGKVKGRKWRH